MIEGQRFLRHYLRSATAITASAIVAFLILLAFAAPWVAPHNPYDLTTFSLTDSLKPPAWKEGGSSKFLLGTDDQGRDILSMIIFGLRTSFIISFSAVGISFLVGAVLGLIGGYFGGWWDAAISRLCDTMLSFPAFLMALLLLGVLKQRGAVPVIIAIVLTFWVRYTRLIRGNVLGEKKKEYIDAAKSLGASHPRIIFRHLLPNSVSVLFVIAAVDLAMVIVLESTLSFLGVGVPLTMPSLGMLISSGYTFMYMGIWWIVIFPGFVLALLVFSINLLGDWLREELNPKMRG
jgi:peptide/nickel transport system permease protein